MKQIIVTRKKKLAGAWVPFWIISSDVRDRMAARFQTVDEVQLDLHGHPRPSLHIQMLNEIGTCIRSGETVTVTLEDRVSEIYAVTMDGILSNRVMLINGITVGDAETFRFTLTAKGGFRRPCYPLLLPESL